MTEPGRSGERRNAPAEPEGPSSQEKHVVRCVFCLYPFDLFGAPWCAHEYQFHPSKICPRCKRCLCGHPSYGDAFYWKEAPLVFQRNGFRRLFLLYM